MIGEQRRVVGVCFYHSPFHGSLLMIETAVMMTIAGECTWQVY